MDHLGALFVSDDRMECREIRKCRILQFAPDDPLDCKVSVVDSGLERLFPIWKTVTRKVRAFSFFPNSSTILQARRHGPEPMLYPVLKRIMMAHVIEWTA